MGFLTVYKFVLWLVYKCTITFTSWYWGRPWILVRYMILILNCISASSLFPFSLKKQNQCSLSTIYSFCRQFICQHWSLKVLSGQIRSALEWYHWIGFEKDINRYRFLIFDFLSGIFKVLSRFMQKWIQHPNCLEPSLHVLKPHAPKCGRDINCFLDYGSLIKNSNIQQSKPKWRSTLVDFFIK